MLLTQQGKAKCRIELAPGAGVVETFAANELVDYVERMSKARLEIGGTGEGVVKIGLRSQLAGVDLPDPKPGFDGYTIRCDETSLVIAGDNERGVLYGVYDVLERLGCRFYYPTIDERDPEIVPDCPTLELEAFSVAEASGFKWRVCHPSSMIYELKIPDGMAQMDWACKARYNGMAFLLSGSGPVIPAQAIEAGTPSYARFNEDAFYDQMREFQTTGVVDEMRKRGMFLEGPLHCMINLLPNSLFDEHPEWFGMANGQRLPQQPLGPEFCWSNEQAVSRFTENAVRWVQTFPFLDVFSFTPNDGGRICECPECAKHRPEDMYARLANSVREGLIAAGIPRPVEITGGYPPIPEAPTPGVLHPEVRYHWAHWGRHHGAWYGDPNYSMRDNLDGFMQAPHPFTMVEYYPDAFATPAIMPPVASAMNNDTRWLLDQGVVGQFSLMHPQDMWWATTLNAWLGISWYYNDRDARHFLRDYAFNYYGAAGEAMVEYFEILDRELWLSYWCQGHRWFEPQWVDTETADKAGVLLDRLQDIMARATQLATDDLDAYRLSRRRAQFEALASMGRARINNTQLVEDHSNGMDVAHGIQDAITHEQQVIAPLVQSLVDDHTAVLCEGPFADRIRDHSEALSKALEDG